MTIGEIIIKFRNEHKLSQREFAKQCGLSNGSISIIESGINPNTREPLIPNLSTINQLAKGMNISIQSLIESAEDLPISLSVEFDSVSNITVDEKRLITDYRSLNETGKKKILDIVSDFTKIKEYKAASYYRVARSQDNTKPEIIEDTNGTIDKLKQILPVTDKEDF